MRVAAETTLLLAAMFALTACHAQSAPSSNVAASAPQFEGLANISDGQLQAAVRSYYLAESRSDWKGTYGYRSANFRKIVPFPTYAKSMSESFSGWRLLKITIDSSTCAAGDCTLHAIFCEQFNPSLAKTNLRGFPSGMECSHVPNVLWRQANGNWEAIDAGTREHVPLNTNMADH
jgi:hypothetical protein